MAYDLLLSSRARARGYFRPDAVEALVHAHDRGTANYAGVLWALLTLELWHRIVVEGERVSAALEGVAGPVG